MYSLSVVSPICHTSLVVRQPMTEQRDGQSSRRRRWYLGIQSKKDPAHVMTEVYKAMQALNCTWHPVNNYRVLCLWAPQSQSLAATIGGFFNPFGGYQQPPGQARVAFAGTRGEDSSNNASGGASDKVKIALSLYKVQQNIYLLDFQRVEVCRRTD